MVDLTAMLEKSVSEAKASRTGGADVTVHDLPAAKKTTKRTTAAKKTAEETPAKKSAGRKPRSA
ncbi:hypothetical protein ABZ934_31960 [Streptomyces sp. NPDC046557]|uniref:hypothetical protein n=1 Tax=Streptomyces sp. NPDC046557 TaxID=3155372 RepID=UPI003410FD31